MVKPNSTVTKKGRLGELGRGSRYKVLMCICINFCDKESASSLLTAEHKKENDDLLSGKSFKVFQVFPI